MIRVVKVNGLRTPEQREKICYVGRAFAGWPASKWGNPYRISVGGNALERFAEYAWWRPEAWLADLWEACEHGAKPLGCWCVDAVHGDGQIAVCHAQVLAAMLHDRFVNREESIRRDPESDHSDAGKATEAQ